MNVKKVKGLLVTAPMQHHPDLSKPLFCLLMVKEALELRQIKGEKIKNVNQLPMHSL